MTEEDEEGNVILPFPKEMMDQCKWVEGDTLDFDINEEGVIIKNISLIQREGAVAGKVDQPDS